MIFRISGSNARNGTISDYDIAVTYRRPDEILLG
jgi:hypothetical protein